MTEEEIKPVFHGDGSVSFPWGGDMRRFNIGRIGQLKELQQLCGCGPYEVLSRLMRGTWKIEDYREVIRLGLVGADVKSPEVVALVRRFVEEKPPLESVTPAGWILTAGLTWPKDESVGKPEAEGVKTEATVGQNQTEASSSPHSMETARPSALRPEKLTPSRHGNSAAPLKAGTVSTAANRSRP